MAVKIALAGNPNCGKTTLFNALTGSNQFVGNWPGVTVEKKEGKLKGHKDVVIMDLPGIYSLSPYTLKLQAATSALPDPFISVTYFENVCPPKNDTVIANSIAVVAIIFFFFDIKFLPFSFSTFLYYYT
mgnify:CR=1 FL=1